MFVCILDIFNQAEDQICKGRCEIDSGAKALVQSWMAGSILRQICVTSSAPLTGAWMLRDRHFDASSHVWKV
jgi:hypothetical protein